MVYGKDEINQYLEKRPKYGDPDFVEVCGNLLETGRKTDNKEIKLACYKILAYSNCTWFSTHFLSHLMYDQFTGEMVPPASFHSEVYRKFETSSRLIVLAPREHAKTTVACNFYPTWGAVTGRFKFILIICASIKKASDRLIAIRQNLEKNEEIVKCYGKLKTKESAWSSEKLVLANGCTIEAAGVEQPLKGTLSQHGMRPDLILLDDPFQDPQLIASKTRRQAAYDWIFSDILFLGAGAKIALIATIQHEEDPGARLARLSDWEVIRYGAANLNGQPSMDFEAGAKMLWPEKYTQEWLLKIYKSLEEAGEISKFWNELMNMPQDTKDACFPRYNAEGEERPIFYTDDPMRLRENLRVYIACDPAWSMDKNADRKVSIVVGVDEKTDIWYVLDIYAGRDSVDTYKTEIIKQIIKWKPLKVGVESNATQSEFINELQKKAREFNAYTAWEKLKPVASTREFGAKHSRIVDQLVSRYLDNRLKFRREQTILLDEMWSFIPGKQSKHDDCLDALANIGLLIIPVLGGSCFQMIKPNTQW